MKLSSKITWVTLGLVGSAVAFWYVARTHLSPSRLDATRGPASVAPLEAPDWKAMSPIRAPASQETSASVESNARVTDTFQKLDEILASKNDNDPRLDQDLKKLQPEVREALRARYRSTPRQARNDRGTIVFLLGRNLESAEDFQFLQEVFSEPPCFNLEDCQPPNRSQAAGRGAASDETGVTETTLIYPQLVGLHYLERALNANPRAELAQKALQAALKSPVPRVREKAEEIRRKYGISTQ